MGTKLENELCTILSRTRGLLDMIKKEIESHEDRDDNAVLMVVDVLEDDLQKAHDLFLELPKTQREAA